MRQQQDNWQRIESVIRWANMTINYFARYIGLPRGENLYQIKRGNNGISRDVAQKIVAKFPQISMLWLLTGNGKMFSDNKLNGAQIPLYDVDVEHGISIRENLDSKYDIIIPELGDCDFAMLYTGRAMGEVIPSGSIVFLKKVDTDTIIPGSEYVMITQKIVTLRIVRAADRHDELKLVAGDRTNFDDIILKIADIEAVYKVCGKLIINN